MEKIDFKKELKQLYNPSARSYSLVDVPAMNFLMIDGEGAPSSPAYADSIEALYAMSFTLKFMSKEQVEKDYVVMPLEGLWWADDMNVFRTEYANKDQWKWTSMIMQPDWISQAMVDGAVDKVRESKNPAGLAHLRYERFEEGKAVQIMHIGPYADEGPTIVRMHDEFIPDQGLVENGKHHEIYLSDPRRTAPERLRTVIRHPVTEA